jgi:hypothetical protein
MISTILETPSPARAFFAARHDARGPYGVHGIEAPTYSEPGWVGAAVGGVHTGLRAGSANLAFPCDDSHGDRSNPDLRRELELLLAHDPAAETAKAALVCWS